MLNSLSLVHIKKCFFYWTTFRAENCKKIRWFFGVSEDKKMVFWFFLTFNYNRGRQLSREAVAISSAPTWSTFGHVVRDIYYLVSSFASMRF
jgi:hypothetical protein